MKINPDQYSTSSGALFILLASICGVTATQSGVFDKWSQRTELEALAPTAVDDHDEDEDENGDETTTVINWSGTHSIEVPNQYYFEPETVSELESIVAKCQKEKNTNSTCWISFKSKCNFIPTQGNDQFGKSRSNHQH